MYEIAFKLFGHPKKMTKKEVTKFIENICKVSKDDIVSIEADESENGILYTVTIKGEVW